MYGHKKRYFEEDGNSKSSLNIKKQQKMPKSAKFIFENPNKTKWSVPIIFFYACSFSWETKKWYQNFEIFWEGGSGAQKTVKNSTFGR